uniref:Prolyl endopeptidase n=1 Tax=Pseudo-nitzschia australis TaxID=44445 RepID=A0A7S4AN80_9STRA
MPTTTTKPTTSSDPEEETKGAAASAIPPPNDFFVEDMDLFRTYIVLYERSRTNGDQRIRVRQRNTTNTTTAATNNKNGANNSHNQNNIHSNSCNGTIIDISSASLDKSTRGNVGNEEAAALPPPLKVPLYWSKLSPVGNMCFEANFFRFELESPFCAGIVYEYNFDTQEITRVSGGKEDNDSDNDGDGDGDGDNVSSTMQTIRFKKEKIVVESLDGTGVPLSLFYKGEENQQEHDSDNDNDDQAAARTKKKTVVLVGYGAYGEPMDVGYNPGWKPLLDRGVVIAFAHTRGGGDLGRAWYGGGRQDQKANGIQDYEACALYLRKRFSNGNSCSLVAKAFSAGGVLVGAAVNRHPGLFDRVVLTNAFVDVFRTMERADLFLTEHEYDEFGNPSNDPVVDAMIRSYCPIFNLDSKIQMEYTKTRFLLIGSLDDPNVPYWNATLYFRKLLEIYHHGGRNPIHFGEEEPSFCKENDDDEETTDGDRVFLELQLEGGHNFSSQNRIEVLALETAFILKDVHVH